MLEPSKKRTIAFIDGQNLFYAAKQAFGYPFPNYDPSALRLLLVKDDIAFVGVLVGQLIAI